MSARPRRQRGSERRRFARIAGELVASCKPRARGGMDATTLNFSAGGVLFRSVEPLEPGQDVEIALRLPASREDVRFDARVVRVRAISDHSFEIAAEFAGGDARAQRALLAYIEAHGVPELDPLRPVPA